MRIAGALIRWQWIMGEYAKNLSRCFGSPGRGIDKKNKASSEDISAKSLHRRCNFSPLQRAKCKVHSSIMWIIFYRVIDAPNSSMRHVALWFFYIFDNADGRWMMKENLIFTRDDRKIVSRFFSLKKIRLCSRNKLSNSFY